MALLACVQHALGRWRHARLARDARLITIQPPPEVEPASARALWANLVGLLHPAWKRWLVGQAHVAFEYVWDATRLEVRLWVPGTVPPALVERAVEAAWPAARTITSHHPAAPLPPGVFTSGGRLVPARAEHFPLRSDHDSDPLRPLLGATTGLAAGEYACVQVLARPATGSRLSRARQAAAELRSGSSTGLRGTVFDLLTPGHTSASTHRTSPYSRHPERSSEIKAILDKAGHPRFHTEIRYGVATSRASDPEAARTWLRGRAHALAAAFAVFAGAHNHLRRRRLLRSGRLATRGMSAGALLSVPELAALAHLPWDTAVPGLARAGAPSIPPSPAVPTGGTGHKILGDSDAGAVRPIALAAADARHHVHVLGATGAGKTTAMAGMALQDAAAGTGTCVFDPKGDLVRDLLARLPAETGQRMVLVDPDDRAAPPSLNVLTGPDPVLAVDNLVGICRRIWSDYWGPRTDDILRASALTLSRTGGTLADVPRLLADDAYRRRTTHGVRDELLRQFWTWYDQLSEPARAHAIAPLQNKLRAVLLRPFVRSVLSGATTPVDMSAVLDGGICLLRLPKGTLGADTTQLLGSLVLAKIWEAATHRVRNGEHTRRDASLYLDECQNWLLLPHHLGDMLAEARAYRLSLTLAHQNLSQLPSDLREAISANARTKLYFAASPEDAHALRRHVHPTLTEHDLAHLGAYQAAARLIAAGAETPACTLRTRPLPPPVPGRARDIRRAARTDHPSARVSHVGPRRDDPRRTNTTG